AASPRWTARCRVLSRANSAAIRAPCVLASHSPIAPNQRVVIPLELQETQRLEQPGPQLVDEGRVDRVRHRRLAVENVPAGLFERLACRASPLDADHR